jgi:hypothetical protein
MPHRVRACLGRGLSDPCTTKRYGNSKGSESPSLFSRRECIPAKSPRSLRSARRIAPEACVE